MLVTLLSAFLDSLITRIYLKLIFHFLHLSPRVCVNGQQKVLALVNLFDKQKFVLTLIEADSRGRQDFPAMRARRGICRIKIYIHLGSGRKWIEGSGMSG